MLYKVKKILGVGEVYPNEKNHTYMYIVGKRTHLLKVIELFNGKLMFSKRQHQFKTWISLYNRCHGANIKVEGFEGNYEEVIRNTA